MSLGFEKAGYDVLLGIDIWKDALETYKFNHHNSNVLCADMSTLTGDEVSTHLGTKNVDEMSMSAEEATYCIFNDIRVTSGDSTLQR